MIRDLYRAGYPTAFVDQAVCIASAADDIARLVRAFIGQEKLPPHVPPPPPLDDWLPLYRDHRAVVDGAAALLPLPEGFTPTEGLDILRTASKAPPEEIRAEVESLSPEQQLQLARPMIPVPFPPSRKVLREMLAADDELSSAVDDAEYAELFATPGVQFFLRVWFPCWVLHHEYPTRLLHRARLGDLDALDALLRLDKSVVADPAVARQWHRYTQCEHRKHRERMLKAISGKPKSKLTAKKVRHEFAGLISQLARAFGCDVTAPRIARLFDDIAHVRGRGSDRHIGAGEAFSKAVRRSRHFPSLPDQRR